MYYEIFLDPTFFIYKFNWLFNNNNTSMEFFFSSFLSSHMSIFVFRSGHTNVHSSIAEKKKKWPFPLLIFVFVEWTFLTLIRGDSSFFFYIYMSQPIYFTFFFLYVRIYYHQFQRSSFLCVSYWSYRLPEVIIVLYIVHFIEGRWYESLLNNEISCNWE